MADLDMATDASGNLEDFFDFAQLEHDNGLHHHSQQECLLDETSPVQVQDIEPMDWQQSFVDEQNGIVALPTDAFCGAPIPEEALTSSLPTLSLPESVQYQPSLPASGKLVGSGFSVWHMCPGREILTPNQKLDIASCSFSQPPQNIDTSAEFNALQHASVNDSSPALDLLPQPESAPRLPNTRSKTANQRVTSTSINTVPPMPPRQASIATRKPASAKRKGPQTRIPLEARQMLEEEFAANPYPCSWEIDIIAHQANLDVKRVRNWYNNTRARRKCSDAAPIGTELPNDSRPSLSSKLSKESLEALDKQADETVEPPQPPLAVYLAQSYQEEAVPYSTIQAAIHNGSLSDEGDFQLDTSSSSKVGRTGSVITSLTSSDGTAPTTYTVSSSGSNISSFGRDRRRGRRRMTWRASPYTRTKFNGLNSAGQPQEDLPFFCTFCPRAFKTKYEWIRHEDSVHALRTTYICCDNKNSSPQSCPFCGQMNPDEVHLAAHKYQQCRNKPESQRTFYRRDHFVQHLHHVHFANVKHPSARLGCQARLMGSEGHNFGCKDLAVKWRRFGAPMKADDPMLHCGFCGKRCKNWSERCDHVAEHLIARELDRSTWWAERLENHLENLCHPCATGPFRCRYCQKVFANSNAMNKHTHCRVWSCRFLRSFDDIAAENAGPPLCPQFPSPKAHHCHLCGAGYRSFHVEHAQHYHRYRLCDQQLYTSEEDFLQHLHEFHGASHPSLLRNSSIIEQNFSRNKGASFEGVGFDEILQGCRTDLESTPFVDPFITGGPSSSHSSVEILAPNQSPPTPPRKKPREENTNIPPTVQRQRSDSTNTKLTTQGPRFFRLNPLVPFLASRIYYLRNAKPAPLFSDGRAVLEEVPKSHIASLVMSSGLLGMAGARWPVYMKRDGDKGTVEFALEEDDE